MIRLPISNPRLSSSKVQAVPCVPPPGSFADAKASPPYLPGEIIDNKYRLLRPAGQGGMGAVWVGHNVVLDVHVAIKLIGLSSTKNAELLSERLLQEARAAARLGHPAIVRVFDFGRTRRGDPFVVMELVHGETLANLLDRQARLAAIEAVQMMLPIADALAAAHNKGIVHRDVKPENVILANDEAGRLQPKLLDFGIASMVETDNKLTLDGAVLGTPDYMSPEQARGAVDIDHRTDVWSFSVVLYELLTGRLPFAGKNYNSLLGAIIHDHPTPILEYAAGDDQLWRVLERGLRKRAGERWETMRVMGEALALWLYERGVREDACAVSLKTSWLDSGLSGVRIEVASVPAAFDAPLSRGLSGGHSRSSTSEPRREPQAAFGERTSFDGRAYAPEPPPLPLVPITGTRLGSSRRRRSLGLALGIGLALTTVLVLAAKSGSSVGDSSPSSPESSLNSQMATRISAPSANSATSAVAPMTRRPPSAQRPRAKRASRSSAKPRTAAASTRNRAPLAAKRPPAVSPAKALPQTEPRRATASKSKEDDFGF